MRFVVCVGIGLFGAGCNSDDGGTGDTDACGGGTSRTADILCLEADTANGEAVYFEHCDICHGPDAAGLPGLGSSTRGKPAAETVETLLMDPPPAGMIPFTDVLSDQEMADVAGYLESLPPL